MHFPFVSFLMAWSAYVLGQDLRLDNQGKGDGFIDSYSDRWYLTDIQTVIKQMCRAFIHHILIYSEFTLMLRVVISPPSELMHHRAN